jgi:microsomal dipeptidase-like Zn-dependent dipeptidase
MIAPTHMSIDAMRQAAADDAYLEFVYNSLIGSDKQFSIDDYVKAIREVGPEHCILASDLGQPHNPLPAEGLKSFVAALMSKGVSAEDISLMSRTNPARALGLP